MYREELGDAWDACIGKSWESGLICSSLLLRNLNNKEYEYKEHVANGDQCITFVIGQTSASN